jgi:hypothetical protein
MKTPKSLLYLSAAMATTLTLAIPLHAQTVVRNTSVTQIDLPHTTKIDFKAFDLNGDGILSTREVGQKLFYVFDTDDNQVIDNIEFNRKTVLTIIPMQQETVTLYDFDNDGKVDAKKYSYETFTQTSGLARFAKNEEGLSPADFIGKAFNQLDVNNDKAIDIDEWKGAYIKSLDEKNREAARYN